MNDLISRAAAIEAAMSAGPSYYMTQTDSGFQETHTKLGAFAFRTDIGDAIRVLPTATPAPVVPAEGLERALLAHHEWHQRLGVIVFPPEDDQDGPTEIDMSAEYADSRLHEQTVAALSGASIVQSVDDHAHAALSHALQYLRGEAPNVMSGGHRNGQLRSMIKWVLLGCGGPLRSAPPVGARVGIPSGLIDALRSQRQIDADGCEVAVSRQACDEAAAILAALLPAGEEE